MSKSSSKTPKTTTTSSKARKLPKSRVAAITKEVEAELKKAESAKAFAAALKEQNKGKEKAPAVKTTPKPVEAPKAEKKAPKAKHEAIVSGGSILINEAVGIHFRADAATAPSEGDMVMVVVGKSEVPLIVSCTKELIDGSTLIQAFVTRKSGDHAILGAAKGESATVIWK